MKLAISPFEFIAINDAWELFSEGLDIDTEEADDEEREPNPKITPEVARWYLLNFSFDLELLKLLPREVDDNTLANIAYLLEPSDELYRLGKDYQENAMHIKHKAHAPEIALTLQKFDPTGEKYPLLDAYNRAKLAAYSVKEDELTTLEKELLLMARTQEFSIDRGMQYELNVIESDDDYSNDSGALFTAYKSVKATLKAPK